MAIQHCIGQTTKKVQELRSLRESSQSDHAALIKQIRKEQTKVC